MRKFICALSFILAGYSYSQNATYYLIGRPYSFSFNNALQEIADNYGFTFSYALGDVYGESMSNEIGDYQKHNDSIVSTFCKNVPNCIDYIFEEANYENIKQDSIRSLISAHEDYICKLGFLSESYMLFDKKSNKRAKYMVYLIGDRKSSIDRSIETIAIYLFKRGKLKTIKTKKNNVPVVFSTEDLLKK
jgi:hypothetical protein